MEVKPLLALHGWQDNAGTWDRLAPLLPSDVSVLAIDSPGHGLSSNFPKGLPYYITDQIFVIRYIAKYFGWDQISLLAHSMGAVQSFLYCSAYPDQVDKLICVDAFKPLSVDPSKEVSKLDGDIEKFLKVANLDSMIKPSYSYSEAIEKLYDGMIGQSLTKESCEILLKRGTAQSDSGYYFTRDNRLKVGRLSGWLHKYVLHMASCITCNVLFIKAEPGLVFEKPQITRETLETIKKAAKVFEYHVVEGTHHVHLNNPERVAPIIIKFLKGQSSGNSAMPSITFKSKRPITEEHLNFL